MRLIPILGLFFFLKSVYKYQSYRAMLIISNGILLHGLKTPRKKNQIYSKTIQLIRIYDLICNILMIIYTIYSYPITIVYATTSSLLYFIELYIEYTDKFNENITDLIHIFGVHYPLSIGLYKANVHIQNTALLQ